MTTTDQLQMRDQFLQRLEDLYAKIEEWIRNSDPPATLRRETITVEEVEYVEPYEAPVLVIERPTYETVRLAPRGRWILGAEGRVDMKSALGSETLLYLNPPGPYLSFRTVTEGGRVLPAFSSPVSEVADPGWHFLQSRHLGLAPTLDHDLFLALLEALGR